MAIEKAVRDIPADEKEAPAVIYIDEVDAIAVDEVAENWKANSGQLLNNWMGLKIEAKC